MNETELPELKFLRNAQINKILWDQKMLESSNGLVCVNTWYLDAVTNDNWDALVSNNYEYMMPLPIKNKFGIHYLPTPVFVQQLGIFGPGPFTTELSNHFIKHLSDNIKLIEYQLNTDNLNPTLPEFEIRNRTNIIKKLPLERHNIKTEFNENTQRNIKKAEKSNVHFGNASIRQMIKLFQDNKEKEITGWKTSHYNILDRLYNGIMLRKHGESIGAYNNDGELIAGAFITEYKNRATFVFSCNSPEGKENGALPALIHHYMQQAPSQIEIFDFEGSDNDGLARFYMSFGSIETKYVHLKLNRLPFYMRWLKP